MKKKTNRFLMVTVVVAFISVLLCFLYSWINPWGPSSRINSNTFKRIQLGMSREDIHSLIGLPPGKYTDTVFQVRTVSEQGTPRRVYIEGKFEHWVGPNYTISVDYNEEDQVVGTTLARRISKCQLVEDFRLWSGW